MYSSSDWVLLMIMIITSNIGLQSSSSASAVPLTLLSRSPLHPGAVCLDGSLPGYHVERGYGTGERSWLVHLEGGGWCSTVRNCMSRARTALGSSSFMTPAIFDGHLSSSPDRNPGFYNWNRVLVRYCDGASFSGNVDEPLILNTTHLHLQQKKRLFFRGQRVWHAIMDEILTKQGMRNASKAILSGSSAGGLATFHHCNYFRNRMPQGAIVKCLVDGGLFLDLPTISGVNVIKNLYQSVTTLHNVTILPRECTKHRTLGECFFPQYNLDSISVPMFFLQSSYDSWQLRNVIAPPIADPFHEWSLCKTSLSNCSSSQLDVLHEFRQALLNLLEPLSGLEAWGMHIVSCLHHTEEVSGYLWNGLTRVNNMTAVEAFNKWFFEDGFVHNIDCEFSCNQTCQ